MAFSHIGSWGLPEFGLTEKISDFYNQGRTSEGGSNILGASSSSDLVPQYSDTGETTGTFQQIPTYTPTTTDTSGDGGGTGGGGTTLGTTTETTTDTNNFPSAPETDWDALFAPAFGALDLQQQLLGSEYNVLTQEAEADVGQQLKELETERETRLGGLQARRTQEQQTSESAVSEAKRIGSEIMQGIQSRYGTSTGTGGFAGELIGRETVRNVAGIRQAVQNTMNEIGRAEESIKSEISNKISSLNTWYNNAKKEIGLRLNQQLADISTRRGELEVDKGLKREAAIQEARDFLAQIQLQNNEYANKIKLEMIESGNVIEQIKARAAQQANVAQTNTPDISFSAPGEQPVQYGQNITGQTRGVRQPTGTPDDEFNRALGIT